MAFCVKKSIEAGDVEMVTKRFILCTLITLIVMGIGGCMRSDNRDEQLAEKVVRIYNERYDDTFVCWSTGTAVWSAQRAEVFLLSEKYPEVKIRVWIYEDGTMVDNYMAVKFSAEVENVIKPLVQGVFGDCVVVNNPVSHGSSSFSPEMSLEAYMGNYASEISMLVAVETDITEEKVNVFTTLLKENGIVMAYDMYQYDSVSAVQDVYNAGSTFPAGYRKSVKVWMDSSFGIESIEWGE